MALDLVEIAPSEAAPDVRVLIARATVAAGDVGSAVVEAVWAARPARLYLIVDGGTRDPSVARDALLARLRSAELPVKRWRPCGWWAPPLPRQRASRHIRT